MNAISIAEVHPIVNKFLNVFCCLATLGDSYTMQLKEGVKPHALFTSRNVPLPLLEKVRQELQGMESLGVIANIEEPTSWCAAMIAVPKRSGDIRMC